MTLVAHSTLPTFSQLRTAGHEVLSVERATRQDVRELHIGFLNMMPDAALRATERQFIRLVGNCNQIAQFYVYPFSLSSLNRSAETEDYIGRHYTRFEQLKEQGLDALIITGANVANPDLTKEPFWGPLTEIADWAQENVSSTLCSCLATHALLKHFHGIDRQPLPAKRWGVYSHRLYNQTHPVNREINTRFDVPHSRFNDISRQQLEDAGLQILSGSSDGGVHMAVSPDGLRVFYFQGHPEYDHNSLLKEYKRELQRFCSREIDQMPPLPENYFPTKLIQQIEAAGEDVDSLLELLNNGGDAQVENSWGDTAKAVFNNWLGLVYQFTNHDRRKQFMPGVDPADPLGINKEHS